MTFKSSVLTFLLAGLICSVTWLSADEPVTRPESEEPADVDVPALLKRIDRLEQRVDELEEKVAQYEIKRRLSAQQERILKSLTVPESEILKNLPPQEINGIRYYHVPLRDRER
jgi:hypothetical protein